MYRFALSFFLMLVIVCGNSPAFAERYWGSPSIYSFDENEEQFLGRVEAIQKRLYNKDLLNRKDKVYEELCKTKKQLDSLIKLYYSNEEEFMKREKEFFSLVESFNHLNEHFKELEKEAEKALH